MSLKITYPMWRKQTCPQDFRCTECNQLVLKGAVYYRAGHGRYCVTCTKHIVK